MWKQAAAGVAAIAASLALAAPAHADNASYLQYLRDRGFSSIMVDLNSQDSVKLSQGYKSCEALRHGYRPPILDAWGGAPLIVEAAQRELCPDTLG
jgi:hypothetical protein